MFKIPKFDFIICPTSSGIGSGSSGTDQTTAIESLIRVWRGVEKLLDDNVLRTAGLCDLRYESN